MLLQGAYIDERKSHLLKEALAIAESGPQSKLPELIGDFFPLIEESRRIHYEAETAVRGMLSLASQGTGQVAVKSYLEAVSATFRTMASRGGIYLRFELGGIDPSDLIEVPQAQFGAILSNLIINAIEAFEPVGNPDKKIVVTAKRDRKYICIFVKDNADGIAESAKHNLFRPGVSTKANGSGFGLAQVNYAVKQNHGKIRSKAA